MGFNILLTAAVNAVLAAISHLVASAARRPLVVGFLVGASTLLCQLNFTSAVYWSQLSRCLELPGNVKPPQGYSCERPGVYWAIGLVEGLLFLAQLCGLLLLSLWQEHFVDASRPTRDNSSHHLQRDHGSPLLTATTLTRGTTL